MKGHVWPFALAVSLLAVTAHTVGADDWPGWRGSNYGVAPDKDLPVKLSKDNVLWKIKLPGAGASSPITYGDRIFVTCYSGYGMKLSKGFGGFGKGGGDQKKLMLHLICLDQSKGKIIWQKDIKPKLPVAKFGNFTNQHGYASSTPVTDGERIYVFFGKSGVVAFDMDGKQLWQQSVGTGTHKWGTASSPILYKDLIIVNAAIEGRSLVALNKHDGKEVWRVKGIAKCWVSPVLVTTKEGKVELVMNLPGGIIGYNPQDGKELWHCEGVVKKGGFANYTCATPVVKDDVVYVIGGSRFSGNFAVAVRAGGSGDVTKSHVLWKQNKGTNICSAVLTGDYLFWITGRATCLNTADGKLNYNEQVYSGGQEYVSAVAAGDTIYALTRFNGIYVLAGDGKFQVLDHFEFAGDNSIFNASPAISNNKMFVRSNAYLYCIGKK